MKHPLPILASCLLLFGVHAAAQDAPPNVVLIMADDLGWRDVGFNGGEVIATPHLDAWAADALVLDRFYSASPVCSPTRASVMTGRHPHRLGITHANTGHLSRDETTLAELLRGAGYRTGFFGKWHLGTLTRDVRDANRGGPRGVAHFSPPQDHGFDAVLATESKVPTFDPLVRPAGERSNQWWHAVDPNGETEPYGTRYWDEQGAEVTDDIAGDDSVLLARHAAAFIADAAADDTPFLAVVWLHAPHLPVVINPAYAERYAHLPEYDRAYACAVTGLDEAVGAIRAALRDAGVEGDTIVWFCSDNGPEGRAGSAPGSAGPWRGRKRDVYDGGVRVPAFVAWPNGPYPVERVDWLGSTSDILPTLARHTPIDVTGLALDGGVLGADDHPPVFFALQGRAGVAVEGGKLVRDGRDAPWQAFDTDADPGEAHPLPVADDDPAFEAWRAFEASLGDAKTRLKPLSRASGGGAERSEAEGAGCPVQRPSPWVNRPLRPAAPATSPAARERGLSKGGVARDG